MIKYLGSKRALLPAILDEIGAGDGRTVIDLFSGTARVARALRERGFRVLANDHNAFAATLARCYLEASAETHGRDVALLVDELNRLPGAPGYFTATFSEASRYVHPDNGARVDAIREAIVEKSLDPITEAVVLTALLEATDRVDSTCGVQMAYLKSWAARAKKPLELRVPALLPSAVPVGRAHMLDALDAARALDGELAYLDPPYNQHSYLGNYHVWESLVRWDKPEVYGRAQKRVDVRTRKSDFNSKGRFKAAFAAVVDALAARTLVVSFNDEGFITTDEMTALLARRGRVARRDIDYKRYVGAQIGIYNLKGERVGTPGRRRNTEHLFVVDTTARRDPSREAA